MMNEERALAYNAMVAKINAMSIEELYSLINQDKCPFEPEHLIGVPLGMFHCDCCGEMVVAGIPHPRYGELGIDRGIETPIQRPPTSTDEPSIPS